MKPLSVIGLLGPTGVGKTALAIELARQLDTMIVSCDSMQVYAGFPVLTNQPLAGEEGSGRHELVGFREPGESFSAAEYADLARPLIKRELASCGCALVAGGSGLYMRAALAPLATPRPGDPDRRRWLEERACGEGAYALHAELARIDVEAARSIDPRNVRRVIRALEGVLSSGRAWSGRGDLWAPAYYHPTMVVALVMERGLLGRRIEARAARMVQEGAIDEVRRFRLERGEELTRPGGRGICSAIGYTEICRYLDGEQGLAETVEQITAATRRYARRQLTWLRKIKGAVMIDVQDGQVKPIARRILRLATRGEPAKEHCDP